MQESSERRRESRYNPDVPIEVEVELGKIIHITKDSLNNISISGLSFYFSFSIDAGRQIRINIPLGRSMFVIKAEVMWCEQKDAGYNIGAKFLEPSDAFKAKIYSQIRLIEEYKRDLLEKEGRDLTFNEAANEWIRLFAWKFEKDNFREDTGEGH